MKNIVFSAILLFFTTFVITCALAQSSAMEWTIKGTNLLNDGKYEEALKCFDKALEKDPDSYDIWLNKGNAYFKLGNYEKACGCYNKSLEYKPDYISALTFKGRALIKLQRYEDAIKCFDKVLAIKPDDVSAKEYKKEAEKNLTSQSAPTPVTQYEIKKSSKQWNSEGTALYREGKYNEAIACYDKALEIDPMVDKIWDNKGNALHKQEKYTEAIVCYDKALAINSDNDYAASTWYFKGRALYELGRYTEAIECYDKALSIKPSYNDAIEYKEKSLKALGK